MKVTIGYLDEFERGAKALRKKYPSFVKGKSGGSRVLTYNIQQQSDEEVSVTLMTIYDKGDISNVSDAYIRSLVQQIE